MPRKPRSESGRKTIAEIAKETPRNNPSTNTAEIQSELPQISTEIQTEGSYTPSIEKRDTGQNKPVPVDVFANAHISVPSIATEAANEGLTKTNAYAAKRIGDFSRQEILAKTAKIKQIARQRKYSLDELVHSPEQLQSALDDYDLTCLDMGLYPLQNLLAVWLNTNAHQIVALQSAANVSEAGRILACHSEYCIATVSNAAMLSDKPPLFSIYYLKTAHSMYDQQQNTQLSIISGNVTNIAVSSTDITQKAKIFTELNNTDITE